MDLLSLPGEEDRILFPPSFGTRFMLVVDTEEAFDWGAPFEPGSQSISETLRKAMAAGQDFFAGAGVRPLYACDYSVIDDPRTGAMLAGWADEGLADIGAHLHPWSNPPYVENVSTFNSFAGNLPHAVERAKLTALRDRIVEVCGRAPLAFRAGRYGIGPNTGVILRDLGFRIDSSVRSGFDYSEGHGPDFSHWPVSPYRTGPGRSLIELPLSTAFAGGLRTLGGNLVSTLGRRRLAAGFLARSGLLQRIPLTPEGVTAEEAIRAIDQLLEDELRLLMFSFHSPTLAPGNTPYGRDAMDVRTFFRWWETVLAHLARRGVSPVALDELLAACSHAPA